MKLQKLTIHNIASIEDATIDFDAQPLADSEVFLITGKTGAGKSTILDAICLALYADTPRLDTTKMQGDTLDGEKAVKIDDPRQLMRRNTGEASVTLTFIGSNGCSYEASWSVARARNKATGNLKSKEWQLHNLDTDICLTKEREIREEIHAAIGLDFKQFCRTTLLAQGEFTRFLNSKDDEKAEILEKITGVSVYTKIGAKVYEITNQKKRLWEDAEQLVKNVQTLSDEVIAQKKEEITALETQYQEVKKQHDTDKKKCDWLKTDAELAGKVKKATEDSEKAAAITQSEDFKKAEALVSQWQATIEARNWLTTKNKAKRDIEEGKTAIGKQQDIIDAENKKLTETLNPAFEKAGKEAETAKVLYERQQVALQSQEANLAALNLSGLRKQREETKDLQQNIKTANDLVTSVAEAKEKVENARQALAKSLVSIEESKKKQEEYPAKIHDAEVKMNTCKELLDKQKDTIDKFAKTMRQKLHVGDKCPVCGQEIVSELPHEEELAELERQAKEAEQKRKLEELQNRLNQSGRRDQGMGSNDFVLPMSDEEREAVLQGRRSREMEEMEEALGMARAHGRGRLGSYNGQEVLAGDSAIRRDVGKEESDPNVVTVLDDDAENQIVVKKKKEDSEYFNTLSENAPESHLIKAIIDEEVKATEGSRVRLRLLDDIEIGDIPLKKGSYLYATMSGFSKQRAKGKVESIMVGDDLFKVSLTIFDTDGLEGLYVPGSEFMETMKDVGSSAMQSNMNLNDGGGYGNNVEQWAMQGLQNAYRRTSNAISKAIKKNKVRLKYGTQVYLVNGKDKKKK